MPSWRFASGSKSSAGYHTGYVERARDLFANRREDLHQAARPGNRDSARIEARLLANQRSDERRIERVGLGIVRQLVAIEQWKEEPVGPHVAVAAIDELLREANRPR